MSLRADPTIKTYKKKIAEQVTSNDNLKHLLKKGKMYQVTNLFGFNQRRKENFQSEAMEFFGRTDANSP